MLRLSLHLNEPARDGNVGSDNAQNHWPRVRVCITPLSSLEECIRDYRLQKELPKSNGGPLIVVDWSRRGS